MEFMFVTELVSQLLRGWLKAPVKPNLANVPVEDRPEVPVPVPVSVSAPAAAAATRHSARVGQRKTYTAYA